MRQRVFAFPWYLEFGIWYLELKTFGIWSLVFGV
jgi:hypothetical protein